MMQLTSQLTGDSIIISLPSGVHIIQKICVTFFKQEGILNAIRNKWKLAFIMMHQA
jgi:hypothetical protein